MSIGDKSLLVDATCNETVVHLPNLVSIPCLPYSIRIKNISKCKRVVKVLSVPTISTPFEYNLKAGKTIEVCWESKADLTDGKWVLHIE